ncbi:CHASE domain-containing protein [Marinicellulosiphila megalodicopiae]|uniref:CHASE domain-containing protein n=1 Tax=Marinicellulosiphila megalodicopiae TaxID=2724896 RepID=UPI003BB02B9A
MKLGAELEYIEDSDYKQLVKSSKLNKVHWFIISFSLILTLFVWQFLKFQVEIRKADKFSLYADQTILLIEERLNLYKNALTSAKTFVDNAGKSFDHSKWQEFSNILKIEENYPGVNGIGVIFKINEDNLDAFTKQQQQTRPYFGVYPNTESKEKWPITFIEPELPNFKAIGLDVSFEKNRLAGVKKAVETGQPTISGPIVLVQDAKQTPGFLFYVPFYKDGLTYNSKQMREDNVLGVVYAPFIMSDLMIGSISHDNLFVSFAILDGDDVLYQDENLPTAHEAFLTKSITKNVFGRQWVFSVTTNDSFENSNTNNQPLFVLIGGLIINILLFLLFIFLAKSNKLALSYADSALKKLNEKTVMLENSNHDLEQFSYVASHDLKSPINSINQIGQWLEEDCGDILPDKSKEHLKLLRSRTARMMKLLDDILNYSRIKQINSDYGEVNLREFVEDILSVYDLKERYVIDVENKSIFVQKSPLEIILRNLITNSIKHHDQDHGTIVIHHELSSLNHHVFTVSDDGPGIPEDLYDKALEMFQTLKSRDKVEGSGMGLTMIQKIISQNKGTFELLQNKPNGLVVKFSLPNQIEDKA